MNLLCCLLLLVATVLGGCKALEVVSSVGAGIGSATGAISPDQAESIKKTGSAVGKAFEKFTLEQEYYLGRAVTAQLLGSYKARDDARLNAYVNQLGQTLAAFSDRPETFKGYHFAVMDTEEINAFAAPGGFVLISRGLLKCCKSEDALAAVLAHEIGHVQLEHGIKAINKGRWTTAATTALAEGAKSFGSKEVGELTTALESSVSDVTSKLVNSGYATQSEYEADKAAVTILLRVGYSPLALREMLREMKERIAGQSQGFAKTHPTPAARLAAIEPAMKAVAAAQTYSERQKRFESSVAGL
jgi:predicted Zn-dependent protease